MSIEELPAAELARIDAVCIQYETDFRHGLDPSIASLVERHGGTSSEILRHELELVRDELSTSPTSSVPGKADGSSPSLGTKIGPYLVQATLGKGGMGVVYQALDQRLGRSVAIKMLAPEFAQRRDLNERFEREARAVAGLSHPNIVELFDVGKINSVPYAVMEHLVGESLDARLEREPLSIDEVHHFGAQIADALSAAHQAGVVHRDLKPQNIMLVTPTASTSTIVKLFDFGLSRAPRSDFDIDTEQTREGMILGTPGYMAPEQVRGEPVTPAADIFSLGCLLHEAFYRQPAFDGNTKAERLASTIKERSPSDPKRRRDDVPLAKLIEQCLRKDPKDRPISAAVIADQLRRNAGIDAGSARIPKTSVTSRSARRQTMIMLAIAAAMLLIAIPVAKLLIPTNHAGLSGIESIAVLSFTDEGQTKTNESTFGAPPIGDKSMHRGEELSALLVHELSRMPKIRVPRFRPVTADTPQQLRDLGKQLEVDALLSGAVQTVTVGEEKFLELDLQLISSKTGTQIWGRKIKTQAGENFLEQSRLATEIAAVVGQTLTSTAAESAPPTTECFRCLVDGQTRSDPDSLCGLTMALRCFEKAHIADPRFADPVAGIALTSITLAGQSSILETPKLVQQARENAEEALRLDPTSIDARLAMAMLDWQTVGRYEKAEREFRELATIAPNHWQVQHQYGLLQLALGQNREASKSLREASLLNPMSMVVKLDRARAAWFAGDTDRAMADARYLIERYEDQPLAKGLLVDLLESLERYAEAAAVHDSFAVTGEPSAAEYFAQRRKHLTKLPYGPFGEKANEAIWRSRVKPGIDDATLADLGDPMPPMLPLLLAAHPSFNQARQLNRAIEILPPTPDP